MTALIHDPLTRFIAQAVAIIVVSRLTGLLTRRLGQPMVIAEIVAGVVLGPSLLGWLVPEFSGALFAPESLDLIKLVSQIGLVLFMFLVGLELDPRLLRGRGRSSVAISLTSIALPFVLGGLFSLYLFPRYSPDTASPLAFALFMGAAMSVTAFPVLARILTERRLLRSRVGTVAIACAAVDDVSAWCILAFVVAVTRASGVAGALVTTAIALVYIAFMLWAVRPVLIRLAARVATPESMTQNVVAIVLVLVFLSSWATELIGIHALFGAFLFGAVLPKDGGFARALAEKLEDLVLVVFLPLFFAYSGLRTEIGLLDSTSDWAVCAVLVAVASLGKFGGSALAARVTGLSWRESGAVGALMNTRGLMELIVLNIGLDLGVISPTVFSMMVVMALVTTFVTTPVVQWIYPAEEMARDLLERVEARPTRPEHGTLICISHGRVAPGLVTLGGALTPSEPAGRLYAVHLVPSERQTLQLSDTSEDAAAEVLDPAVQRATELGLELKPLSFLSASPAADLVRVSSVRRADLVLLGWHKPVLSRTVLGGVVHDVLRDAEATVGVFVDRGFERARRVLVPFQGSPHDRAALDLARRLLHAHGADVTVLHVVDPTRQPDAPAAGSAEVVSSVFEEDTGRVTVEVVEHASPAEAALARCADDFDLIVVGVGRTWGLESRRFGVQPERLIQRCPTSLLIVRGGRAPAGDAGLALARLEQE